MTHLIRNIHHSTMCQKGQLGDMEKINQPLIT